MINYTDYELREAFKKSSETISQTCRFEDITDYTLDRHLRLYNEIVARKAETLELLGEDD